ncbi:MAG: hypothetical protein VX630_06270, partial [Candidatus Neomarinimicrobiota bacterium]|nr:hypothetical protein [Candidatus Neomarinimicrobiota bacterium]
MAATPYTAGAICFTMILGSASMQAQQNPVPPAGYQELVQLFSDWREFEDPPLLNGAPDYTPERFAKDHQIFQGLEKRLNKIKIGDWPTACQVDWHIVRAEMNGYDFNYRVLKPWVRDPAYYQTVWMDQSDVPAHEGPTNHATLEFWTYQFPISSDEENRLSKDLKVIPGLLKQARDNLTGNARDLWIAGIENIKGQTRDLDRIAENIMSSNPQPELTAALKDAQKATVDFTGWLEKQAPDKTGPSGIGKENYTWYQQNVHL